MTRKLQLLLTTLLLTIVGVTGAWADGVNLLTKVDVTTQTKDGEWTSLASTQNKTDGTLTLTPGSTNEFSISFTGIENVNLDHSQVFLVIEATSNSLGTETAKVRNITLDGISYDNGSSNTHPTKIDAANMDSEGSEKHELLFLNPIKPDYKNGDNTIASAFLGDGDLSLTSLSFNLKATTESEITIFNMGFYNLGEILANYPYASSQWQYCTGTNILRIQSGGNNNAIRVQIASSTDGQDLKITKDLIPLLLKSLGTIPSGYNTLNFRSLYVSDAGSDYPTEDVLSFLPNTVTTIQLNSNCYRYLPTAKNVQLIDYVTQTKNSDPSTTQKAWFNYKYHWYRDGGVPKDHTSSNGTTGGAGSEWTTPTQRFISYTRNFKKGYSTMIVPFEVNASDLEALGITAYGISAVDGSNVTFTKLTGTIANNTPMIVNVPKDGLYLIPRGDASLGNIPGESVTKNSTETNRKVEVKGGSSDIYFVGSYFSKAFSESGFSGYNCYGVKNSTAQFLKMGSTNNITYFRAFLADKSPSARELMLSFEDETTGISETMSAKQVFGEGAYFDLSGRRVAQPTKGLYIVNGKKVVIK